MAILAVMCGVTGAIVVNWRVKTRYELELSVKAIAFESRATGTVTGNLATRSISFHEFSTCSMQVQSGLGSTIQGADRSRGRKRNSIIPAGQLKIDAKVGRISKVRLTASRKNRQHANRLVLRAISARASDRFQVSVHQTDPTIVNFQLEGSDVRLAVDVTPETDIEVQNCALLSSKVGKWCDLANGDLRIKLGNPPVVSSVNLSRKLTFSVATSPGEMADLFRSAIDVSDVEWFQNFNITGGLAESSCVQESILSYPDYPDKKSAKIPANHIFSTDLAAPVTLHGIRFDRTIGAFRVRITGESNRLASRAPTRGSPEFDYSVTMYDHLKSNRVLSAWIDFMSITFGICGLGAMAWLASQRKEAKEDHLDEVQGSTTRESNDEVE